MIASFLSLTSPAPQGFLHLATIDLRKLRRGVFCLYSEDAEAARALVAPLAEKLSGILVSPGPAWQSCRLAPLCHQWTIPKPVTSLLVNLAMPYLEVLQQAQELDDRVKAQAWDLARAAQDRVYLSRVQMEFRDAMLTVEKDLREAHRYLNQIIEFLPDATLVIDEQRRVTAWNRAMEHITGVHKEDMLGKGDYEYAIPLYGERRPILVDLLYVSDVELSKKYDFVSREGSALHGEVFVPMAYRGKGAHLMGSASLLFDQDGNIIGAIETIRDITERHQAMEQLQKAKLAAEDANRAKSQFLSNVSHEIRTPLNGIIGFTELIMREENLDRTHSMARAVLQESDILLSLVNAILDQALIESGKMHIACIPTDLHEVLETVTQTVAVHAKKKGIVIHVERPPDVPRFLHADRLKLCQVLLNLMNNSLKYTERGVVELSVSLEGREDDNVRLRFDVVDTGCGIPDDKKSLIFQRFAQVDAAATRKHGGAGLGLSLARGLVELMGGTIGFDSRVGQGSRFWFILPFSLSAEAGVASDSSDASGERRRPRETCLSCPILLVEDHLPNQEVARMHLESVGYKVDIVNDGSAALRRCVARTYSLILMDIQMPEMDGFEATRRLRNRPGWTETVVILGLSANADEQTRKECLAAGMNSLITKPLRRETFLAEVARWLSGAATVDCRDESAQGEMAGEPMNIEQAIAEFGGNKKMLSSVVTQFIIIAAKQLQELKGHLKAKNIEAIRREAHKIKGASANITAMRLSAAAKALEEWDPSKASTDPAVLIAEIEKEFEAFRCFVDGHCCP